MLTSNLGLQTPRLKRLAEIVSAQAMAQQEKADMFDGGVSDVEAI
jgi:myosin V